MKKAIILTSTILAFATTSAFAGGGSAYENAIAGNGKHKGFDQSAFGAGEIPRGLINSSLNGRVDNGNGNGGERGDGKPCLCRGDEDHPYPDADPN